MSQIPGKKLFYLYLKIVQCIINNPDGCFRCRTLVIEKKKNYSRICLKFRLRHPLLFEFIVIRSIVSGVSKSKEKLFSSSIQYPSEITESLPVEKENSTEIYVIQL